MAEIKRIEDIRKEKEAAKKAEQRAFKETVFDTDGSVLHEEICPLDAALFFLESDFGKNKRSKEIYNLVLSGREYVHKWGDGTVSKYSLTTASQVMDTKEVLREMLSEELIEKLKEEYRSKKG